MHTVKVMTHTTMQDMAGALRGHYKARGEVLLRLEFINAKHSKILVLMLWAGMISSQVILWWELGWKLQRVRLHALNPSSVLTAASLSSCQGQAQQDPGAHAVGGHDLLPGHPVVGAGLEAPAGALACFEPVICVDSSIIVVMSRSSAARSWCSCCGRA